MNLTDRSPSIESPFIAYSYAYPHKSAYRSLTPPVSLATHWRNELRDSLFLYFHVPFCEYRCGFCNLFTLANPDDGLVARYLHQLKVEAETVRGVMPDARFARIAIGGGTPTFLNEGELQRFLEIGSDVIGAVPRHIPVSCEASPATFTSEKAALLRDWGVDRLSLGVQSFDDQESRALGRPQHTRDVFRAIDVVRNQGFPTLNLDLIYGVPGQPLGSWLRTVAEALRHRPEEIYLYPLYIRELTGLGKTAATPNDERLEAYRLARRQLLEAGYEQRSLRMFQLVGRDGENGPVYCCQSDGMIGIGCGARSYTRELHYSTEYAVGRSGVRSILTDYLKRNPQAFRTASHGYWLDSEDQRRRYTILSLLQAEGIFLPQYRDRFGAELLDDLPQFHELLNRGLAQRSEDRIQLTGTGLELSDAIGPWLYSPRARKLMEEFECN